MFPVFRSQLQGELLAQTLLQPDREQSLTMLATRLDASVATVQREVARLEKAGLLQSHRIGNTRLVKADTTSEVYDPLAQLVLRAFGPIQVVAEEFAHISEIDELFVFGSWAARYQGIAGSPPADVDVLVIGRPNRDVVYEAALRAEHRLGRAVNTTIRTPEKWERREEGFIKHLRSSPLVPVLRRPKSRKAHQ